MLTSPEGDLIPNPLSAFLRLRLKAETAPLSPIERPRPWRSSLWIVPFIALLLEQIAFRTVYALSG